MKCQFIKIVIMFICLSFTDCFAQELIGDFYDWKLYKGKRLDEEICYLSAIPMKTEGSYDKRGQPYFLVNEIKDDANEISVSSGFLYKKNSNVEISFGSKKYYLFPHEATAFANKKSDDIDILKEMQKNANLVVSGVTREGSLAIDSYSLIGFVKAYKKMQEVCRKQ